MMSEHTSFPLVRLPPDHSILKSRAPLGRLPAAVAAADPPGSDLFWLELRRSPFSYNRSD